MAVPTLHTSYLDVQSYPVLGSKVKDDLSASSRSSSTRVGKQASYREIFLVLKDRLFMDFIMRGGLKGGELYLNLCLKHVFGLVGALFLLSGQVCAEFTSYMLWGMGALLSYKISQRVMGEKAKSWQYYLLFEGKTEWNWQAFKLALLNCVPYVVCVFAYYSIFFSPYIVALTAGLTLLLAPFVFIQAGTEEVMDRNILAKIMQSYGFTSAGAYMVLSGMTFALAHFVGGVSMCVHAPLYALVYFMTAGITYADMAYATQGIEFSSVFHMVHNLMIASREIITLFATSISIPLPLPISLYVVCNSYKFLKEFPGIRENVSSVLCNLFSGWHDAKVQKTDYVSKPVNWALLGLVALDAFKASIPVPILVTLYVAGLYGVYKSYESTPLQLSGKRAQDNASSGEFVQVQPREESDKGNKNMPTVPNELVNTQYSAMHA